ncbi:hypothetical protein HRK28_01670 [Rathayibacter sp. VKM Ac-2835]|uniref:coiled-coil domain-containing protein n=1 Tax=Rathayibacter sp. VKM Ac-2835 TaxID=2739043 RepID=UPI0015640159|nr:hypothetical protein [Rathayibacter sp. VKM Ac-2835]NRG39618.1 hypothetical protein [Rathayibacter sp. VKM Ac-2835]
MIRSPLGLRVSTSARRRLVAAGAGTVLVLCAALAAPMAASAYDPADYPSWSDVEAAKSSESATAAEVDRITAILADLRDQAAALTDAAISRAAEADAAQSALDEATQRVTALEERATAARADADAAKEQAGRLAAQLYRNGGTDATLNLLVGGEQSDQLLYRLGTMSQLTLQTSRLQDDAETTENAAASLAGQAEQARTERLSLVSAAQDALATAQAAQADADAKVADQEQYSSGLYEQLASLKTPRPHSRRSSPPVRRRRPRSRSRSASPASPPRPRPVASRPRRRRPHPPPPRLPRPHPRRRPRAAAARSSWATTTPPARTAPRRPSPRSAPTPAAPTGCHPRRRRTTPGPSWASTAGARTRSTTA